MRGTRTEYHMDAEVYSLGTGEVTAACMLHMREAGLVVGQRGRTSIMPALKEMESISCEYDRWLVEAQTLQAA